MSDRYQMLLVSVPASLYTQSAEPFGDVRTKIGKEAANLYTFNIPDLRVGTLDSLMILDQELAKVDVLAEQSIAKIQRQYGELCQDESKEESKLSVKGTTPTEYLQEFVWDEARYSHTRRLNELVYMIQQSVGKMDDDMKALGQDFNETKQNLSGLQRKRNANLMVADLKDVLSDEACLASCNKTPDEIFTETTFLQSVAVIVAVAQEQEFLRTYERLCADAVALKDGTTCSPVVPKSHFEVLRDADGYILYRVFLLKGLAPPEDEPQQQAEAAAEAKAEDTQEGGGAAAAEPAAGAAAPVSSHKQRDFFSLFSDACRVSRFLVKKFERSDSPQDDEEASETLDAQITTLKQELDQKKHYLKRRCTPYFEDVYVAWIHIKAIRVFVESVLRYGVPPQFYSVLIVPTNVKHMRKIRQVLEKSFSGLDFMDAAKLNVTDDVQRILGGSGSATTEFLPYISVGMNFLEQ
jgi:V-type H+-transporting ATPase subunit C